MAEFARKLVKANNLQDVVEVIEESMEDVVLPEKGCSFSLFLFSSPCVYCKFQYNHFLINIYDLFWLLIVF